MEQAFKKHLTGAPPESVAADLQKELRGAGIRLLGKRKGKLNMPALALGALLDPKWHGSLDCMPAEEYQEAKKLLRSLEGGGDAGIRMGTLLDTYVK